MKKALWIITSIVMLAALGALWTSPDPRLQDEAYRLTTGDRGVMTFSTFGCQTEAQFRKGLRKFRKGPRPIIGPNKDDQASLKTFLKLRELRGVCDFLLAGTEVVIERAPRRNDNFCVRPIGQVDCLWTNRGWVKRHLGGKANMPQTSSNRRS
jgi:hypothetical protein